MTSILAAFVGREPTRARWVVTIGLALLCLLSLVARLAAIFTEAVNWDEFALLARAESTLRLGQVAGGGRPGLVSVALIPFVTNCANSVWAVVQARVLWHLITLAYLAGVYFLVRRWFIQSGRPDGGRVEGTLAVALLAFLPAFVTWSVQVRTDQAALAAAVWGGVALLSPGNRNAALAGALFGLSLLCTQKGLYVVSLCGLLFLAASASRVIAAPASARSEFVRAVVSAVFLAAGMAVTIGLYLGLVPKAAQLVTGEALGSTFAHMSWYRERLGYRAYAVQAPNLPAHWLLLVGLIVWTARAIFRRDAAEAMLTGTCWSVLALGLAIVAIHGSSFPYFLMTAGLFPAVALGMSAGRPLALAGNGRWKLVAVLVFALISTSAPGTIELLKGSQAHQRRTMRIIESTELAWHRGYQVEGALFCSRDPDPLPTMFTQQIERRASLGPDAFDDFMDEFRKRPVAYIVESYRMRQFPADVQQFWQSHYVRHSGALFVAGFQVQSGRPSGTVEVLAPGDYRWIPARREPGASLRVDGRLVRPAGIVRLEAGRHRIETDPPGAAGTAMFAIAANPNSDYFSFYDPRQLDQLRGLQ